MPLATGTALLIGGGLSAAGSLFSNLIGNHQTNSANMELAKYQYKKDLEMWNANNIYNSPEQQMIRLSQAGLNPNLVYGNGSVVGNTSGQLPKYQAPRMEYHYDNPFANAASVLTAYQNYKKTNAEIDLVNAQVDAVRQRTINDTLAAKVTELTMPYKGIQEEERFNLIREQAWKEKYERMSSSTKLEVLKRTIEDQVKSAALKNSLFTKDIDLKRFEIDLRKLGLGQNDNVLYRILGRTLSSDSWRKYWK